MSPSMGGLPGGLNPETILIRSPMPSDAEALAPALVPDVAGPTIRSKGDGRPTKSPPRPRINPEGTCCAVNVVGCGGAEAVGGVVGCGGAEAAGDAGRSAAIPIIGGWTSLRESAGP